MGGIGDGFVDDSVKGPAGSKTQNNTLQGPFAYEKKIKGPSDDPELSQHVFNLPVDSEHKAKAINLFSLANPHMRSFHLNWAAFFITFFSAYAAAPLIPTIRQDVGLTGYEASQAGEFSCLPSPMFAACVTAWLTVCTGFAVVDRPICSVQVWSPPQELSSFVCSWVKRATSSVPDTVQINSLDSPNLICFFADGHSQACKYGSRMVSACLRPHIV